MSEATPGPWSHGLDMDPPDCGIDGPNGGCVGHVQYHGNINTVARTGEEFSHADARLIAASPCLFAACEALVAACEALVAARSGDVGDVIAAMDMAERAIAKAKGQT